MPMCNVNWALKKLEIKFRVKIKLFMIEGGSAMERNKPKKILKFGSPLHPPPPPLKSKLDPLEPPEIKTPTDPPNRNQKPPEPLKFKLIIPSKYHQFSIKMMYNSLEMPNIKHEHKSKTISYNISI